MAYRTTLAALLAMPLMAQAAAVTVDAGNFNATYDTSAFTAGRSISSNIGQGIDGYAFNPAQFQVSTGQNSLRIDFVELPAGIPSYYHGADTLLSATGLASLKNKLSLALPLTLTADLPDTTAYRITIGTYLSGTPYTPFSETSLSGANGNVSITNAEGATSTLIPITATVPTQGITTPIKTVYTGLIGPDFDLTAITGSVNVTGAYTKPCCGVTATFGIDYIQIEAISAVPEPGTYALMGLGLVGIGLMRRQRI